MHIVATGGLAPYDLVGFVAFGFKGAATDRAVVLDSLSVAAGVVRRAGGGGGGDWRCVCEYLAEFRTEESELVLKARRRF